MKRCPTCNQTFEEDWLSFCTHDGTTLIDESASLSEPPLAPAADVNWEAPSAELPRSSPERRSGEAVTPAWQPPPPPAFVYPPSKSLATAAMVLGIVSVTVGWLCFGPIPGIAAIILGGVALSQIKKTPDRVGGKQMAWIGVVTGSVTVLLYVGIMIFYIVVMIAANA